jgi:hypothetical protein
VFFFRHDFVLASIATDFAGEELLLFGKNQMEGVRKIE